jgi:hypothetical protein
MRIALTLLPHELRRLKLSPTPSYRCCYNAALNGLIPAEQADNGRWSVDEDDLPQIVETFRRAETGRTAELPPPTAIKADNRSRKLARRAA